MTLTSPYDWLEYTYTGDPEKDTTVRNLPLSNELLAAFNNYVPQMGLRLEVASGGQPSTGSRRTGSHRHDDGMAADVRLLYEDRVLSSINQRDREIMAQFITNSRRNGLKGIGHDDDAYMGPELIHVGYGTPAVWGDDGLGVNAPDWVRNAWAAGANPVEQERQRYRPGGAFRAALTTSESSGNPTAYNNEVGAGGHRGHGGLLQFGTARLADAARAGVIPRMTAREFSRQPVEVQERVADWHFQDIDQQIERLGLSQYYGQTINGVPVDHSAITAMAHLGGIGGAARFLRTNGEYNPADSYGTRLSDYGQRFAGMEAQPSRGRPDAEGSARSLDFDSVLSSDFLRRNSDPDGTENRVLSYSRALMDRYDNAIRNQEDLFGYTRATTALTFGTLMPDIKDTPEYAQIYPPGTPLPVSDDMPVVQGPAGMPSPNRRPTPDEVAAMAQNGDMMLGGGGDDTLLGGFRVDELAPPVPAAPPAQYDLGEVVNPERAAAPTQSGEAAAEAPPEKDWAGFLQALGVGFGQLASGETVNIGSVMQQRLQNRMAQEQAELEQQRYEQEQERLERQFQLEERRVIATEAAQELAAFNAQRNYELALREANLAERAQTYTEESGTRRLDLDERAQTYTERSGDRAHGLAERSQSVEEQLARSTLAERTPNDFDFTALEAFAADNPGLAGAIEVAQRAQLDGDYELRDTILDVVERNMDPLMEAQAVSQVLGDEFDDRMGLLAQAASTRDPAEQNNLYAEAFSGATEEQADLLRSAYDQMARPTNRTQVEAYMDEWDTVNPDATPQERLEEYRRQLIVSSGQETEEMRTNRANQEIRLEMNKARVENHNAFNNSVASAAMTANTIQPYVAQSMAALNRLEADGDLTSGATDLISSVVRGFDSFAQGFLPDGVSTAQWLASEGVIADPAAFEQLDGGARMIGLLMARPLMEGQGSVTDSERRELIRAFLASDQTPQTQRAMLARLQTLNDVDRLVAERWNQLNAVNREAVEGSGATPIVRVPSTEEELTQAEMHRQEVLRLSEIGRRSIVPSSIELANLDAEFARADWSSMSRDDILAVVRRQVSNAPVLSTYDAVTMYDALPLDLGSAGDGVSREYSRLPRIFIDQARLLQTGRPEDSLALVDRHGNVRLLSWNEITSKIPSNATEAREQLLEADETQTTPFFFNGLLDQLNQQSATQRGLPRPQL